jgi:hypothetical protein
MERPLGVLLCSGDSVLRREKFSTNFQSRFGLGAGRSSMVWFDAAREDNKLVNTLAETWGFWRAAKNPRFGPERPFLRCGTSIMLGSSNEFPRAHSMISERLVNPLRLASPFVSAV